MTTPTRSPPPPHISKEARSALDKQTPEKRQRVLDVADSDKRPK